MQSRIIIERFNRFHPEILNGLELLTAAVFTRHDADEKWVAMPQEPLNCFRILFDLLLPDVLKIGNPVRPGHVGHGCMVRQPFLMYLKGSRHVEYLLAVLHGDDAAVGKTAPIQSMIDLINDRRIHITGPQKIRMQGMNTAFFCNCLTGRVQRLAQYLSAENLRRTNVLALAFENILL